MGAIPGNVIIRNAWAGLEAELLSQVPDVCWGRNQLCRMSAVQSGAGSPTACGYTHVECTPTSQTRCGGRSPHPTEAESALVGGQTRSIPQGDECLCKPTGPGCKTECTSMHTCAHRAPGGRHGPLTWSWGHCVLLSTHCGQARLFSSASHDGLSEPAASVSPGFLLEMQITRPRLRPTESEILGLGPTVGILTWPSGDSQACLRVEDL